MAAVPGRRFGRRGVRLAKQEDRDSRDAALNAAVGTLNRRMVTCHEMRTKLKDKGFTEAATEAAIESLVGMVSAQENSLSYAWLVGCVLRRAIALQGLCPCMPCL